MKLKSIFKKTPVIKPEVKETASQIKPEVPEGLLKRCNKCGKGIFTEDYKKNLYICPKCGGYLRMPAQKRIEFLTEADSFEEWDTGLSTENPLHMIGYPSCILAPPEQVKIITGSFSFVARSTPLAIFSPTTSPILAIRKRPSITIRATSFSPIRAYRICRSSCH